MIKRESLLSLETYARERNAFRAKVLAHKKNRSVHLGGHVTLQFEDELTIRYQVQEMLRIERIFEEEGIRGELEAYNPLIPNGRELVATLMFEIEDPARRARVLASLGGVEETVTLSFADETIAAVPEADVDRTSAEGKASSVQFLHFPFTARQVEKFKQPGAKVTLAIGHEKYGHATALPETVRQALARDFA